MEFDDLDLPSKITEQVTLGLANVGIDVPMGLMQGFLLILSLIAFSYGINKLRKEGTQNLLGLLIVVGFGLYSVGIGYSWVNIFLNPLPGELEGSVEISRQTSGESVESQFLTMNVELLDLKGENAGLTFGAVDSRTGRFIVKYDADQFDYPRTLRISSLGCAPQTIKLKRRTLHQKADLDSNIPVLPTVNFRCERNS